MDTSEIRIGIIGAGNNTATRHIPNFLKILGVKLVGVCNRTRASSERVARNFSIPRVFSQWQEVVQCPDIDAVMIGTWPYLHCAATVAALEQGKHVLCEARMAMNAGEARSMLEASKEKPDLVAQVVPSPFTLAVDPTVKELIAEGKLGRILALSVRDGRSFLDSETELQWRQDADLSGLNVMTLGIWYEAIMRWVGEAAGVMARGKIFVAKRRDRQGIEQEVQIPEHLDVIADMVCGAQAHFRISAVTGLAGNAEAMLFGTEGTLKFVNDRLYLGKKGDAKLREVPIAAEKMGYWRVEEEFVSAIRGQEQITHTTFEDGVRYMEFTEAVHRSMEEERWIPLPFPD